VAQEPFLLHLSIRENLAWAAPDAGEDAMWEALRRAAAADFVTRLPSGIDTKVGDRGALLSGGERRRIALARALLRRPSLLVLDEATSALDPETERQILATVEALSREATVLMITHRLASARDADAIHVLDRGRVVQSGTWTTLTAADGQFSQLLRGGGSQPPVLPLSPVL
jgi:ATP-binding cassette subfamily C protein